MSNRIKKSGRILILLLLLSMMLPTMASALNINGIGSGIAAAGSTSGTGGYSIPYTTQAIGYRFALVDSSGNKVSGTDVADVYRSGDAWKLSGNTVNHLYIRRTKQEWITMANKIRNGSQTVKGNFYFVALSGSNWNADKLGTGDTYTDSNWGLSLPDNAADMPTWINKDRIGTIVSKAWGKSYDNFESNKWVLQAEPIYMIMVAKEYLVGTIPEFAFIAVADGTAYASTPSDYWNATPTGGTDGTWGWISGYTHGEWAQNLTLKKTQAGITKPSSVLSKSSKGSCMQLLQQGYGIMMVDAETISSGGTSSTTKYTLTYKYDGDGISSATGEGTYEAGTYAQASFTVKPGWRLTEIYGTTYNGGSGTWYESGNTDKAESDRLPKDGPFTYNTKFTMKASRVLTIVTKPYSYGYTVNHYLQNVSGSGYTLAATDTGTADCGSTVTGTVRSYTGFTSPSAQSITIGTSGNVINYYYDRISCALDLNGMLDGTYSGNIAGYGTVDIYINGSLVANDVTDYCTYLLYGSTYTITDIKSNTGKTYNGVYSGSLSGTLTTNTSVVLSYSTNYYYLDLNGWLNGVSSGNIEGYGTADIYINGSLVANDVTDYYTAWPYGTTYEIKDIKNSTGKHYNGVYSGSLSGTLTSNTAVYLSYGTNYVVPVYYANGGTASGNGYTQDSDGLIYINSATTGNQWFHVIYYGNSSDPYNASTFGLTRPGYTFGGWKMYATGETLDQDTVYDSTRYKYTWNSAADTSNTHNFPCRLDAIWNPISYTITYDANGGTLSGSATQNYNITTNVTLQAAPTRTGYTFAGWKPNYNASNSWDSTKTYAAGANCGTGNYGDVTMVAQWTANTIKITLDKQGGTGGLDCFYFKYGTNKYYTDRSCTNQITSVSLPSRNGYTFSRYYGDGTCGGNSNETYIFSSGNIASDLCTDIYKDATLYAVWTANTIKITLDKQGGTGGIDCFYFKYGTAKFYSDAACTKKLTSVSLPSKTGHKFVHYYGDGTSGGSNGEWYVSAAGHFASDLCTDIYKDATLYAKWKSLPYLEIIEPNASYRKGTEVITSYYVHNDGNDDYDDDWPLTVTMRVYDKAGNLLLEDTQTTVVPANETQLVYFRWTVPNKTGPFTIETELYDEDEELCSSVSDTYKVADATILNTPDTIYEAKRDVLWYEPNVPIANVDYDMYRPVKTTATWYVWECEDGEFTKVEYGLKVSAGKTTLKPDSYTHWQMGTTYYMKSGYGFFSTSEDATIGMLDGYNMPDASAYTDCQWAQMSYPEFMYKSTIPCGPFKGENGFSTLIKTEKGWQLPELVDYKNKRKHFIPVWYPDSYYYVMLIQSDIWTPDGMLTTTRPSELMMIQGNMYDDWYIS